MAQGKFLIDLVKGVNERHFFFVIWASIAGLFSFLMYSFYKKTQQRNFREDSQAPTRSKAVAPSDPKPSSLNATVNPGEKR